jgi:hypothetical protein
MYDGAGVPLTGLAKEDIRVTYIKHDFTSVTGKTLDVNNFVELGLGRYQVEFTKDELNVDGAFVVLVSKDPGYVGAMRQSALLCYIADAEYKLGGIPLDRPSWIPVYLTLSSAPVGGLVPASFTEAKVRGASDSSFADIALSGGNFRELLDLGNPTGIYQVNLPETELNDVGTLDLRLNAATIDPFAHAYNVASLTKKRCVFRLLDSLGQPGDNITLHFTDEATGEVYGTTTTDVNGDAVIDLPVGDYIVTQTKGTDIYNENNTRIQVRLPGLDDRPPTSATVVSGSKETFNLADGDYLDIQIEEGELQRFVFDEDDPALVPPLLLSSATAGYIASILNRDGHSFVAYAGGHNQQHLVIMSLAEGSRSSVQVGGTANSEFNFNTGLHTGTDRQAIVNSWDLNASKFVPAFPAPSTDLVQMTFRIVDIQGRPVKGVEVNIVNKFNPAVRLSDNSAVLGDNILRFHTNEDGVVSDKVTGLPLLAKGAQIDIIVKGTGFIRQNITVPNANFALVDLIAAAEDLFTLQKPNLPPAPRS